MNVQGTESEHVIDSTKIVCSYCGSPELMLSTLMDDPNDITEDTDFAALLLTITGGSFQGLVGLCPNCGHEQVPFWYFLDVGAATGAAVVMTNLDQATTANLLAGLYAIPMVGTDAGLYYVVASNTAAAPTTLTMTIATNDDEDGLWMITNVLPFGLTAAS